METRFKDLSKADLAKVKKVQDDDSPILLTRVFSELKIEIRESDYVKNFYNNIRIKDFACCLEVISYFETKEKKFKMLRILSQEIEKSGQDSSFLQGFTRYQEIPSEKQVIQMIKSGFQKNENQVFFVASLYGKNIQDFTYELVNSYHLERGNMEDYLSIASFYEKIISPNLMAKLQENHNLYWSDPTQMPAIQHDTAADDLYLSYQKM